METCILAKILILLAIISYSMFDCIASVTHSIPILLLEIATTIVLILVTNYYCEHWIAKAIVIYTIIGTFLYFYLCFTNQKITD
jgi:hypothetical protein